MVRGSPARAPFTSWGIGRWFAPPSRGLFCFADSSVVFAWRSGMKPGGVGSEAACTPPHRHFRRVLGQTRSKSQACSV